MNRILMVLFTGAMFALSASAAHAVLINIQPDGLAGKDAEINDGSPDSNFGGRDDLIINWFDNSRSIGLIEFDLSVVPEGATINLATLDLFHEFNSNQGSRYDIFRITSAWSESTVTFNTAPNFDSTAVSSLTISDDSTSVHRLWDVTNVVSDWVNNVHPNYGLWIEEIPIQGNATAYFLSSDTTDPTKRPKLTIDYTTTAPSTVPEPTTLAIMTFGLAGIGFARKKNRS